MSSDFRQWVIMADPARIKVDATPERTTATEEHLTSEETEDAPLAARPADDNKESAGLDHPKEEVKSVSFGISFL